MIYIGGFEIKLVLVSVLIILIIQGCSEQIKNTEEVKQEVYVVEEPVNISKSDKIQDSTRFANVIKSLVEIQFHIMGKDSAVVTTSPTDFIELNSILSIFQDPFDDNTEGFTQFTNVEYVRKYHVQRQDGKSEARPSANIIQITFKNREEAKAWFFIFDNSPKKSVVQQKPKTELWLDDYHVYFIQTYHTPKRDYVDLLKATIIEKLN